MLRSHFWVAGTVIALLLAGCTTAPAPPTPPDAACAEQGTDASLPGLIICKELHDTAPHVRLPDPSAAEAFAVLGAEGFTTLDGTLLQGSPFDEEEEAHRQASTIYRVQLQGAEVTSAAPYLRFDEALFLDSLRGRAVEGLISARVEEGEWDIDPALTVRISFANAYAAHPMRSVFPVELVGTIGNFVSSVESDAGACLPPLTGHGAASTFSGDDAIEFRVYRHPSMHAFGDNEIVTVFLVDGEQIGSTMGRGWFLTPLDLYRGDTAIQGTHTGFGHSIPGGLPNLELTPVAGGGSTCAAA